MAPPLRLWRPCRLPAIAQGAWPSKPIRIICGYPAGGLTDTFARAYGEAISQKTGQPVIGREQGRRQRAPSPPSRSRARAPDGYTLMWTISTTMIMNKVLFKKLPYDPGQGLRADLVDGRGPPADHREQQERAGRTNMQANSHAYARANKTSLGTYGAGSYSHCAVEALNRSLRAQDGSRALSRRGADVDRRRLGRGAGRQRQLRRRGGRAAERQRPGDRRAHQDAHEASCPTSAPSCEQGVTDKAFQVQGFICLVGPAAMPKEIVLKLSDMMVEAGKSERIQKILDDLRHRQGGAGPRLLREDPGRAGPGLDRAGQEPEHRAAIGRQFSFS